MTLFVSERQNLSVPRVNQPPIIIKIFPKSLVYWDLLHILRLLPFFRINKTVVQ